MQTASDLTMEPAQTDPKHVEHGDASSTSGEAEHSAPSSAKATKDEKLVRGARLTVMGVLFVSAVTVAYLAYALLGQSETNSFESQFDSAAKQVILMANRNAVNVFISFGTMAAIYPSHAKMSSEDLPFVDLDDFETIAAGFRNVSKASVIHYAPLLHGTSEVEKWNNYSKVHSSWVADGRRNVDYQGVNTSDAFVDFLFHRDDVGTPIPVPGNGPFVPVWQMSPVPDDLSLINDDTWNFSVSRVSMEYVVETGQPSLTEAVDFLREVFALSVEGPLSLLHYPIYNDTTNAPHKSVTGFLVGLLAWKYFFDNSLPEGQNNTLVVVESCGFNSTFRINGPDAKFEGGGDLHDTKYTHLGRSQYFVGSEEVNEKSTAKQQCKHLVHVFPTPELESQYVSNTPLYYAFVILAIFAFAATVFLLYDFFVTTRQSRTEQQASQSNAIVQELFPGDVANRLFASNENGTDNRASPRMNSLSMGKVDRSTIAELHPEATVLFADICGFTAWSSIRDPHQVFTLLESIFQAFDAIAKKHRVFKVETIGDCYVAACGVPKANPQHAVVMCRFARSILLKFCFVCRNLELILGPDTGDLALRVGMHSGPVTAGVLRGERARFQLFGDTVNTASRLESTGKRERVHISEQTALQLISQGKEDWFVRCEDVVEAKGKGKLVTFWLKLAAHERTTESVASATEVGELENVRHRNPESSEWNVEMPVSKTNEADQRIERLAYWNSELLLELLQRVAVHREALRAADVSTVALSSKQLTALARNIGGGATVVEEVVEIIDMPDFVCTSTVAGGELGEIVVNQLRDFVKTIASMYNHNTFHNFERASHVTMSVNKLLTRIVAPKIDLSACSDADQQAAILHDHTCGITSDPLTQFAVVLSALIHDLDHPGVSNSQLIKEDPKMAERYKEKSVAEQNSVDLAWSVLMAPAYNQLRAAIFSTETELRRFRNLLVNSIIATDIFDKDQGTIRKNRWNKAFYETTSDDEAHEVKSRKATIVIEHLIQASDVSHTMQHWHVYQKWNQRLFDEMMMAYRAGRSDKDPSLGWYGGELWFFDNYVIPLAKKLKDCGVFGVSSDEYLNYAMHNRDEWEAKGKDIVEQFLLEFGQTSMIVPKASLITV